MEALEVISEETSDKLLKRVLLDMTVQLREGETFAASAAAHPEAFPRYYIAVLESAELTGTLDKVLNELAEYMEREVEARSQLTSALIYPAVVAVLAVVTVVILATFVLPKFKTFFNSLNAKLPLPTRMLLASSNFISQWWWAIAAVILGVTVAIVALRRSDAGKAKIDALFLKLPVIGGLVQAAIIERVCRVLASLVTAGVDLPRAMAVTAESSSNAVYRDGINHIREQMMEGNGLTDPLAESGLFPAAARQMFRVGEETGTLDKQLETAAGLLPAGTRPEGEALHEPLRAGDHYPYGCDRRLRRRGDGLGHVRHLPTGEFQRIRRDSHAPPLDLTRRLLFASVAMPPRGPNRHTSLNSIDALLCHADPLIVGILAVPQSSCFRTLLLDNSLVELKFGSCIADEKNVTMRHL